MGFWADRATHGMLLLILPDAYLETPTPLSTLHYSTLLYTGLTL